MLYVSILSPSLHVAHLLCMLRACCKRCHTERKQERESESMEVDQMALNLYETKIVLMHLHISTCVLLSREREREICSFAVFPNFCN